METGATAVVGRGLVEILPDFRKWGKQLAADMKMAKSQLDGTAGGFRKSAATIGGSMAAVGKGTAALGLGVAAVSVKMAGDFQAHTAVLQTAAGETAAGLKVVREGIKNIAVGTGTGIQNLTDGMYTIEKAGYRGRDGLKVLTAAAQGAREENAKLSDVTNAMTSIMASYHLKATDSVRVMNAMKTAAGEGKITMEEFSGALSTVLPIASANKIKFEDVAGSMATLTQHGTSAREATHELAATIRALASPNMVASREMARFGLSATDVSKNLGKRGLSGTVNLLVDTIFQRMGPAGSHLQKIFEGTKQSSQDAQIMLKNMSGEQRKLAQEYLKGNMLAEDWNSSIKSMPVAAQPALRNFKVLVDRSRGFSRELKNGSPASQTFTDALKKMSGGAIGLNTILQITGESAAGNAERIKKVGESFHHNSKDVEGWKVTSGLLNVQLDRMKAQIQVLAINIGTFLIPVVSAVVGLFAKHQNILKILVGTILAFITVTAAAYVVQKTMAAYTAIATAAQWAWNTATQEGGAGILLLRAQLAALFIWTKLQAAWTGIVTAAQWAWNAAMTANPIGLIIVGIGLLIGVIVLVATKTKFFQKIWGAVWGFVRNAVLGFVHWLKANWQLVIFTILTGGIGLAVAEIVRHWDGVKHIFSLTIDWIKHNWPLLLAILTGPIGLAVYWIVKHWGMISDGAKTAYHATINWFVQMGKDIGHFFTSTLPGFFKSLPGALADAFTSAGKTIGNFFSKLPGQIARTAIGFQTAFVSGGADLIKGLWKGATDFFTKSVPDFFKTLWHGIVDFFKAVFGIHSPSTVMASLGADLLRGLLQGMLKIAETVTVFLADHVGKPIVNLFAHSIPDAARSFSGAVSGYWGTVRDHIGSAFSSMKHAALDPLIRLFNATIPGAGKSMRDLIIGFVRVMVLHVLDSFGAIIHGASKLFGWVPGVGGKLKSAAKAFDNFRDDVNRALGGIKDRKPTVSVGMKIMTGKDAGLVNIGGIARAKGGPIFGPGTETSDDIPAWLSHNEHVWTAREVKAVGGHGAMMRLRLMALMGLLKGYAQGGAVQGFASGGAVNVGTRKPSAGAISSGVGKGFSNFFREHLGELIKAFKDQYMSNVGPGVGGGVKRWTNMVHSVLSQLHESIAWTATVLRRMNQESGGNPNIVNKWDSNWKAGHPSVGLMQVIAGTFRAYAGRYRNVGPFSYGVSTNPTANTYAGLNYAIHRYGSLSALNRPGGYDSGGIARGVGAFLKGTLRPERVLSPRQTVAFEHLVGALTHPSSARGSAAVNRIEKLVVENHGVIGSKHEVENWLVESIDQLKRRGRI